MANFPLNQRVFAVETYLENHSIVRTQRRFRLEFEVGRHGSIPTRNTILRWASNLHNRGSVKSNYHGSARSVRSVENIERVRIAVQRSPKRSAKKHSQALNISNTSLRRILKQDLHYHPYKIQVVQKLNRDDKIARLQFSEQFLEIFNADENVLNNLVMTDEAHFHLDGYVNKQNCRYWASENPFNLHEQPLHSQKVTVWCAISTSGIIGPYFFEENNQTVTVNSDRYVEMLETFFVPEARRIGLHNIMFQQDGATAHTALRSMDTLRRLFPGRLISRFGDIHWPARSPDLSAPDFFLWGFLKSNVYKNRPQTLQELKLAIEEEIRNIDVDVLRRVMLNFVNRLQHCIVSNGDHLKDVIFKK